MKGYLHRLAARKFSRQSKYATCVTLVLQTICGSASLAQGSLPSIFEPCIAVLQLVLACAISVMGYLKLEARAEGHRSASLSYNEIWRHLSVILARRSSERPPVFMVMENTEQSLLQLEKIAPLIPSYICNRVARKEHLSDRFDPQDLPSELSGINIVEIFDSFSGKTDEPQKPSFLESAVKSTRAQVSQVFDKIEEVTGIQNTDSPSADIMSPRTQPVMVSDVETFSDPSPPPSDEMNK